MNTDKTENTNDFSAARVGEELWVRLLSSEGYGRVKHIDMELNYPLLVSFENQEKAYTADGRFQFNGPQCLFWSKPEIIAPPRPVRMMKKVVEVRPWIDINGDTRIAFLRDEVEDSPAFINWRGPVQPVTILVEEE